MNTLEYETHGPPIRRPEWYRASIWLAASPMTVGTLVFVIWLIVRWDWLMLAGWITIIGGIASVAAGFFWLVRVRVERTFHGVRRFGALGIRVALAIALLGVNVPLAATYASVAYKIHSRYWITIVNQSAHSIQSFVVTDGAVSEEFGPLPQGSTARRYLHQQFAEGPLMFRSTDASGTNANGTIEGYFTSGQAGHATVTFGSTGVDVKTK